MHKSGLFSFLLISTVLFSRYCNAQQIDLSVVTIPDSLLINSKSIIREEITEFELYNLNKCKLHRTTVLTILSKNGEEHVLKSFPYNKNSSIDNILITIYDKNGSKINSYGRNDLSDVSYDDLGTLYSDIRKLYFQSISSSDYPYTIKYEITYSYNNSYTMLEWMPISNYNQSLQHALLRMNMPEDYKINYKETGEVGEVKKTVEKTKTIYTWEIRNRPAVEYEEFSPPILTNIPKVSLNPSLFAFEGYEGNMSTWKDMGLFANQLMQERNDISDELKTKIQKLLTGIDDPEQKIKIIYQYMQDNTRYVSIQIGIGGLQPFPASTVEKYGYGDCKALSNYMKTLLESVEIKSYLSLVAAGPKKYYFDTSYAHDPFNHVILYVPLKDKELWLECTSQITPFGFLGDFTDDRYALVLQENGGVLKRTTSYAGEKSIQNRSATVYLESDKNAKAIVYTTFSGLYYDDILYHLHADYERLKDYLYDNHIDISDFKINSFEYNNHEDVYPSAIEKLDLELINFVTIGGSRMYIPLNLMNKFNYIPKKETDRINPVNIYREVSENDTVFFHLPEGYSIEHLPGNDSISSDFGTLDISISESNGVVTYIRNLKIYRKEHPKEKYEEFAKFCKSTNKMDNLKLILIKQ